MIEKNSTHNIAFLKFNPPHAADDIDNLMTTDSLINSVIFNILRAQGLDENEAITVLLNVYDNGGYKEMYQVSFELLQDMQLPDLKRKHFESCGMDEKTIDIAMKIIELEKKKYVGSEYCWFNIWSYYLAGDDQNNYFHCPNLTKNKAWRSGKDALIDLYNERYKLKSSSLAEDQYYNLEMRNLKKNLKKSTEKH